MPPGTLRRAVEPPESGRLRRFDELVATGVIALPSEAGDPSEGWVVIRLPVGTAAAALIDEDRDEP